MCEINTVLTVVAVLNSKKKVGHHSEIKTESPCGKNCKKYCLNGGEGYYLVDEGIAGCNCTWLYGGKRCEKYMWWTLVNCSKSDALYKS